MFERPSGSASTSTSRPAVPSRKIFGSLPKAGSLAPGSRSTMPIQRSPSSCISRSRTIRR